MRNRKTWVAIFAAAMLVVAVVLIRNNRNAPAKSTDLSQVVTVQRGNLVASITPTGEVSARSREQMRFDVTKAELIELLVKAGQKVREGDVLARIDTADLERDLDQAKAAFLSAEDSLENVLEPYTELDKKQAQVAVGQAQVALEEAREDLQDVLDPDIDAAEEAVENATEELQRAKDALEVVQDDPSVDSQIEILQWRANEAEVAHGAILEQTNVTEEGQDKQTLAYNRMMDTKDSLEAAKARADLNLLNAENRVMLAEETLIEADEELADMRAGPDEIDLAQAENRVAQAEYNLAKAEDDLAAILAGPETKDIEMAQAQYDAALAEREEAQERLDNATMIAPFDGTIIRTGADVGDMVNSGTLIVTIADLTDLEIAVSVDETDIGKVKVGQQASITFDAFPGLRFQGEVLEVPLEGILVQSIVTYEVRVDLEGDKDVGITPGMTANLTIVVGRTEDALLVSALAIQQSDDGNVVMLQDAPDSTVVTPVQIGLSNGLYVEILRGLVEGDQVVVQYQTEETQAGLPNDKGMMMKMRGMGGK